MLFFQSWLPEIQQGQLFYNLSMMYIISIYKYQYISILITKAIIIICVTQSTQEKYVMKAATHLTIMEKIHLPP